MSTPAERANSVKRTRAYRARQYALGRHYVRGKLTDAPRKRREASDEPDHGTEARYRMQRDPCRCDACRTAATRAARERRARRRDA